MNKMRSFIKNWKTYIKEPNRNSGAHGFKDGEKPENSKKEYTIW